VKNG
ncbi:hypothetical protein ACTFIZ_012315, partial [Dictyostelium cf. discoideum]|jgi:hypothetical protein